MAKSDESISIIANLLGSKWFIIDWVVNFIFKSWNTYLSFDEHWNFSVFFVYFVSAVIIDEYFFMNHL
jgi:hypothetical protein